MGRAWQTFRNKALELQRLLPLFPDSFCLVTGAPRSGTSAMVSWLGRQSRVKSFAETKLLLVAHRLRRSLLSWKRFLEADISRRVRQFIHQSYAQEGVYLGAHTLLDKEPLDPLSLPPNEYSSFLTSVEAIFPSAKFIVMVRNPETVVSSITNRKWGFSIQGEEAKNRTVEDGIVIWKKTNQFVSTIAQKENVYVCQFEKLVEQPEQESKRIASFLQIDNWDPFQPRETAEVTLSPDESCRVWEETRSCRQRLAEAGVSYAPNDGGR